MEGGPLCKACIRSAAQSSNTYKNFPIPIVIALTTVLSATRQTLYGRMVFIARTFVDVQYDGSIRIRRYLCLLCKRTVSLLPEFVLPYLRFSIQVIRLFLVSRLIHRRTLQEAAGSALQPSMPYQRGQFWVRRFKQQAMALSTTLASLTAAVPTRDFLSRALQMLEALGWIPAYRFLFGELRAHLLGWPRFLIPNGCHVNLLPALPSS